VAFAEEMSSSKTKQAISKWSLFEVEPIF